MNELLDDLLGLVYWAAILGGILWWIWSIRQSSQTRSRTPREDAELAGLQAAIDRDRRQSQARPRG